MSAERAERDLWELEQGIYFPDMVTPGFELGFEHVDESRDKALVHVGMRAQFTVILWARRTGGGRWWPVDHVKCYYAPAWREGQTQESFLIDCFRMRRLMLQLQRTCGRTDVMEHIVSRLEREGEGPEQEWDAVRLRSQWDIWH